MSRSLRIKQSPTAFSIQRGWPGSEVACIIFGLAGSIALAIAAQGAAADSGKGKIDFNRDIRPILSENCYKCHGPDEAVRKAKLRLDVRAAALKPAKSGLPAIVPGSPEKSELVARITASDPDDRMPQLKSGKTLTAKQIDLLRRWVAQGAPYATHWAYVKPVRPPLPKVKNNRWARNGIDYFILARLEREGLKPSPEADKYALIRRVSLDLTGLPPTVDEVDGFVRDKSARAYEELVDRLLSKPAFGEHWARLWLDLARYADSAGYADDPARVIWAYRDYVIKSFNSNKPFDRFTLEQIAGDLLPDPTEEDTIATAFHRNTMTNSEGGTDDEEFRNAAVVDRVNTTMAVWMATSMACAQCHDHKYDPISNQDYFRFFAILNNTADADRKDEAPVLEFYTADQKKKRTEWQSDIDQLVATFKTSTPESVAAEAKWEAAFPLHLKWASLKPASMKSKNGATLSASDDSVVLVEHGQKTDTYTLELPLVGARLAGLRLEALPQDSLPNKGPGLATNGGFVISRISAAVLPPASSSTSGRYVRIELPGKDKYLSLAEVQVFDGADNVALKGEAAQSSTDFDGQAKLAIDGNTDGDYAKKSTTHTEKSENPWWEVDLKSVLPIDRIVIWNRTDGGLQSRLSDFHIVVLDEKRAPVWDKSVKDAPNPSAEFAPEGVRSVRFMAAYADRAEDGFEAKNVLVEKADKKQGWTIGPGDGKAHQLTLLPEKPMNVPPGSKLRLSIEQISERGSNTLGSFRVSASDDERAAEYAATPISVLDLLGIGAERRAAKQQAELVEYYRSEIEPGLKKERSRLADLKKQMTDLKPNTVPIMRELTGENRRKTHIQFRGNFLALGDEVTEATPAVFHSPPGAARPNRLALARWLMDENNPLTGRVIANRLWEQIFGVGIVRTSEEFGSQGDLPTHPELLDWLACELRDGSSPWNIKSFLRLLVTSAAYRQSSRVTPQLFERDPDNILLARGPRFRMSAEIVRDQALAVSGLLSHKMYGPSVRPPRPTLGLSAAFGSSLDWKTSEGEDRYRRALYVEWRRTSPYPSMATFDAPNREVCTLRRPRSNTPLQALVTLNDPAYIEAAQALGRKMAETRGSSEDKARYGFRLCLARPPRSPETQQLVGLYQQARSDFSKDPAKAKQLAAECSDTSEMAADVTTLAAWTTVANVLLNLDETLMRP